MKLKNFALTLMLVLAFVLTACGGKGKAPTETLSASTPVATEVPMAPADPAEPIVQEKITTCPAEIHTDEVQPLKYVTVVSNGYYVKYDANLKTYVIGLASPYEEKAADFGLLNLGDYVEVLCSLDIFSFAAKIKLEDPDAVVFVGGVEVSPVYNDHVHELVERWTGTSNGIGIGTEVSGELLYWSFADQRTFTFIVKNGRISIPDTMAIVQDPNYPEDNTRKSVSTLDGSWYYFFLQYNADGSVNISHAQGVFLFLIQ